MQQEKGNLSKSTSSECKNQIFSGKLHQVEGGGGNINSQSFGQYRPAYPSYIAEKNIMPNWRKIIHNCAIRVRIEIYIYK